MNKCELETRVLNLESAISDMQKLLQVMNERITHNPDGIELVAGCPADSVGDIESMGDAIAAIQALDSDSSRDEVRLYDIATLIGKNMNDWGYGFEAAKALILYTAKEAGFTYKYLANDVDTYLEFGVLGIDRTDTDIQF